MNQEQRVRANDSMSTLLLSLISAYAMCAARRLAENLSGRVPSWEVSAELKDWKEAESQLHHAYALYVSQGKSPDVYLSRPDDHGARETAIRKLVYASFCARLNGNLDVVPNLRRLPALASSNPVNDSRAKDRVDHVTADEKAEIAKEEWLASRGLALTDGKHVAQ